MDPGGRRAREVRKRTQRGKKEAWIQKKGLLLTKNERELQEVRGNSKTMDIESGAIWLELGGHVTFHE